MVVLGISGGFRQGYQDASATLLIDGKVIAAIEEERLSRVKFSPGKLPYFAILEVLKIAKLNIHDVDIVSFHGITWGDEIDKKLYDYFTCNFGYCPKIERYHHHSCHAASTFYSSNYSDALVVTYDNSGDGISIQVMHGENNSLHLIKQYERPYSLGMFYQVITQYCGFTKDSDEYKLMGLSNYGNRTAFDFSWLIDFVDGEIFLNDKFFNLPAKKEPALHKDEMIFNAMFEKELGQKRRLPSDRITNFYMDVAASAQNHFENVLIKIIQYYSNKVNTSNLCLAGGGALNCLANQRILNLPFVKNLFIQPASSDAGISIGSAYLSCNKHGVEIFPPQHTFLGNSFTNNQIKEVLLSSNIKFDYEENIEYFAARTIIENKVIGWFQGSMEFGPRALGNRSILANPRNADMKKIVNEKVKFRESFRPFCPSVLEEDFDQFFEGKQKISPYMTITYDVKEEAKVLFPAITHIDGTARIQTVNHNQNSKYYKLLKELKNLSGFGIVLNTSFNLSHEPIVCSPRNAIASFFASGLDTLILGNYIISKN